MKKLLLIFISNLLWVINAHADIARLSLSGGAKNVTFKESHQYQPSLDHDFQEQVAHFELDGLLYFWPGFLYVGVNAGYTSPIISSTKSDEVTFTNYSGYLGMVLPAEPFNIQLESEYYVDSMNANTNFGYKEMKEIRTSVIADWVFGSTHFNIKYPFSTGVEGRSEFMANLIFHYGENAQEVHPSLIKGWYTKFSYYSKTIEIAGTTTIDIRTQQIGFDLGYSW